MNNHEQKIAIHMSSINLFIQLLFTVFWIATPVNGVLKIAVLLVFWIITFYPFNRFEIAVFFIVSVLYSFGNILSVQKEVFYFKNPELFGLPYYEYFMWGFYFLHTMRVLTPLNQPHFEFKAIPLAMFFSASFSLTNDPFILPLLSFVALGFLLLFYHSSDDLRYMAYFVLFGMILEIIGVLSDQWGYPAPHKTAVAPWFFCLFAGSGIICYRIALPLLNILCKRGRIFGKHS